MHTSTDTHIVNISYSLYIISVLNVYGLLTKKSFIADVWYIHIPPGLKFIWSTSLDIFILFFLFGGLEDTFSCT